MHQFERPSNKLNIVMSIGPFEEFPPLPVYRFGLFLRCWSQEFPRQAFFFVERARLLFPKLCVLECFFP